MLRQHITIINKLGLHARAAAKFVALAALYSAQIQVKKKAQVVNGKSIMGVMMLAASKGTELELITDGPDEDKAMAAMVKLVEDKFNEEE